MSSDASVHSRPEGDCPDTDTVDAFIVGELSRSSRALLEEHVLTCSSCRQLLSALLKMERTGPRTPDRSEEVARGGEIEVQVAGGSLVARYVVLELLGEGGMGVVYAARDPELNRKVALKLLRSDISAAEQGPLRRRLRREAQAMAQVTHPNVVTVHDVGVWGDRIYIAMELVEGQTLSRWLTAAPRAWREIVAVFVAAGQGLAAAHAAGLVHRDFKPANVLVGSDGRVRVTDFGLAAIATTSGRGAADGDDLPPACSPESQSLVAFAGTPYYMAPEELRGDPTDARCDQFSFCVALYAALAGEHPYAGDSVEANLAATLAGRLRPPSRRSSMPRWLRRELLRGLSVDPAARHPSMPALLESLARGGRSRRRALIAWSLAGCALIAAGALGLGRTACGWGETLDRPTRLPHAGPPFESAVFAGADDLLEAYRRESLVMHTDACETPRAWCALRATNLLRNAGFDRPGRGWEPAATSSAVGLRRLDGPLSPGDGHESGSVQQEVPWIVSPGRSYTFNVWVRARPGGAPARGKVVLSGVGQDGTSGSTTAFRAGSDWAPVSVTFSPKGHYYRLRAGVSVDGAGSVDIDNAELTGAGFPDASFEDASILHRSGTWRPFNDHTEVQTRWLVTDAFDGVRAVEVRTSKRGGSIANDLTQKPLVGTTYTFMAWLRAGDGASPVSGNLALWALGRHDGGKVVNTAFRVGRSWTRVETSLDIEEYGFAALRAEIYVHTVDAPLEVDATTLVPAGLTDASFELRSPAWHSPDGSAIAHVGRRTDDPGKNGRRWLRLGAARGGGSVVQDVRNPLRGTTYSFSAWVRATPGSATPVSGSLGIRAANGAGASEEGRSEFTVSGRWQLVAATLDVMQEGHTGLRVEVSLARAGSQIDVDGTRLTGAGALLPSLEDTR